MVSSQKSAQSCKANSKFRAVAYAIAVRTSEYDLPPEMLDDLVAGYLPTSHKGGGDSKRTRVRDDDYDAGDLED